MLSCIAGCLVLKAITSSAFVNGTPSYALLDIPACAAEDAAVVEAAARAAAAAADKHEGNKCALVDAGLGEAVVAALHGPAGQQMSAVIAACAALRSPATADDARPITSRFESQTKLCFRTLPKAPMQSACNKSARAAIALAVTWKFCNYHC